MTRFGYVMVAYFASLGAIVAAFVTPEPRFIWNASASAPQGLYRVRAAAPIRRGNLVALHPSPALSSFMAQRHYLPFGLPLLKHVVGLPGDRVCRRDQQVTVNGIAMGDALARDSRGRPLPRWQGCRLLAAGQLFVMNGSVRDSFDGRYFGPVDRAAVIGRAAPIWLSGSAQPENRRARDGSNRISRRLGT